MNLIQIIIDHYGEQFLINGMIISSIVGILFGFLTNNYFFDSDDEKKDDIIDN